MPTKYYIEKDRVLPASQDYHFLLKEGMKYVEQLGSKFWTDYNPHDPGITILEVLCYAITELGYRADFNIQDLLSNKNGEIKNNTFFTAATIFSNAALTEIDYRKLLIDIQGVSNAWILPLKNEKKEGYFLPNDSETEIYLNKLEDKLSFKNTDKNSKKLEQLKLRGLNKVKIELEEDPILGDLNSMLLTYSFWKNNRWINVEIVPHFTNWNHPDANLFTLMKEPAKIIIEKMIKIDEMIFAVVNRTAKLTDSLRFRIFSQDPAELDIVLNYFNNKGNMSEVISLFQQKKEKISATFSRIKIKLNQNRNITEDFLCTEVVEKIDIGICADFELETGVDLIEVATQIRITIDKIVSPKINFHTLSQMVNEGYHSEDIFAGPILAHGFLKKEEIEKAQLTKEIHASDIIAALMEVKGVKAVKNFLMTAYNFLGKPLENASNKSWVLQLPGEYKAVFNEKISKLLLFQKNIPFLLSENQQMLVDQKVIMYKTQFNQKKLKSDHVDLEIPKGNYFELNTYYSIQDDFPANYKLGKNPVSEKDSDLRKAQAKQLKAYLFFYEQILADFFNQLYHAKEIFDTKDLSKTYFSSYLEKNDLTNEDFYSKELFHTNLQTALLYGELSESVSLIESKNEFYSRRNRVLDHLLARFSESFNDYVFMMYHVAHDTSGMGEISFDNEDLIRDKQNFLNIYPEISSSRGLGIDFINAKYKEKSLAFKPFWNTDIRGGYEKRVAKLLGINEISLRDIATEQAPLQSQWAVQTKLQQYIFKIYLPNIQLQEKWDWAQLHYLDQNLYKIIHSGSKFHLYLMKESKKIVKVDQVFSSEKVAFQYLNQMIKALNIYFENFYCLEHILLRPFSNKFNDDDDLLPVCLKDDCDDEANNDPYSFKATLILPGYLSRFKSIVFRQYAEQIFRQEAPAHVLLKICWVNLTDMITFQSTYRKWIESYRQYRIQFCENTLTANDENNYKETLNSLVHALKELNTIYPVGNLYDCQLSETTNPIILGNSNLGTL